MTWEIYGTDHLMSKDERGMVGSLHPGVVYEDCGLTLPPRLDALGVKYGTDKSSLDHHYLDWYDEYFWLHRHEALTLLEIGVWEGASLRMWREYFPSATVVGVDKHDRDVRIDGVQMAFSEQDNPYLAEDLRNRYGKLDIIIDDASHVSSKTIGTFKNLFPILAPGGIYVIEDLQTSYDQKNYGLTEASPDPERPWTGNPTAMQFCKRLADEVNSSLFPAWHRLGFDVASVQFFANICFVTKAGEWECRPGGGSH